MRVYGTPAEEGGGGKIELIKAGAFRDLDLAMMVHPAAVDVAEARPFAVAHSHIAYDGKAAHAGAYPEDGVNANDAFVLAQVAIGLLRQQLPADTRVHGIQTVAGSAPNAIPERTEGRWYVRANSLDELAVLEQRVNRCFEAGALATGAALTITPESEPYAEFRTDERALAAYIRNALDRGRVFADPLVAGRMNRASTDMGNVSQLVPAIHPYIGIDSLPYTNHQKEFADACVGEAAERALIDAAVLMAWTAIDVFGTADSDGSADREGAGMTTIDWTARSRALRIDGRAVIDGHRVDAQDGATLTVHEPRIADPDRRPRRRTERDVDDAVAHARRVFEAGLWSRIGAAERGKALIRLADLMMAHLEELALLETLDSGKPIAQTLTVDVPGAAETFRWYGELADKRYDEIPATPPGSTALVRRVPLGVVGAITPWNYPLEIAAWKLAPALASGNSVVHKPATETSLTALRLADLALEAGIPAGVLNVVPGRGSRGRAHRAAPRHRRARLHGIHRGRQAAHDDAGSSNMKRVALEAGGKSSNLVFADADLRGRGREGRVRGVLQPGPGVLGELADPGAARGARRVRGAARGRCAGYAPSDPLAGSDGNGSLISRAHADEVSAAIARAAADGDLVAGGERVTITGSDAYLRPGDRDRPRRRPRPAPVRGVRSARGRAGLRYGGRGRAARQRDRLRSRRVAVDHDFGRAHRVSEALVAGTVSVNTVDALGLTTPFGGFRQSGFGRDLSRHALDNYTDWKTTWFQHG